VVLKIAHLGRQIRDTNQIFRAEDNVEQVMTKLQDGLMLFHSRFAGGAGERLGGKVSGTTAARNSGTHRGRNFSDGTVLGAVVLPAFQKQRQLVQYEFDAADGHRVQVSLDFIQEKGTPIGALLTMRDAESGATQRSRVQIPPPQPTFRLALKFRIPDEILRFEI